MTETFDKWILFFYILLTIDAIGENNWNAKSAKKSGEKSTKSSTNGDAKSYNWWYV